MMETTVSSDPKRMHSAMLVLLMLFAMAMHGQVGSSTYTIPVVFHVLHLNGPENISNEQILEAVELMNGVFDLTPAPNVDPPFDALVADMEIRFCLAAVALDGSLTNGIDRVTTTMTLFGGTPGSYVNGWPRDRYLNIWTVAEIPTGEAAFALPPAMADTVPERDGIVILHNYLGSTGTSDITRSKSLPYAAARFLNLKRLNEDLIDGGPCGDDEVSDTPKCAAFNSCGMTMNSCDTLRFMAENYMAPSYCSSMFTIGQRTRAHACLNNAVAGRSSLCSLANLSLTGCADPVSVHDPVPTRSVTAHPIPFSALLVVSSVPEGTEWVELIDVSGRSVLRKRVAPGTGELELNGLGGIPSGPYLLLLEGGSGTVRRTVLKD